MAQFPTKMIKTQHNDMHHNDIQHNYYPNVTLSITMLCCYAEGLVLFFIMLNVVMLSVVAPEKRESVHVLKKCVSIL
jgi:hypothetical protein